MLSKTRIKAVGATPPRRSQPARALYTEPELRALRLIPGKR